MPISNHINVELRRRVWQKSIVVDRGLDDEAGPALTTTSLRRLFTEAQVHSFFGLLSSRFGHEKCQSHEKPSTSPGHNGMAGTQDDLPLWPVYL